MIIDKKRQFVLVCPRNPKNMGAVARAMANFGFRNMAVVKPYAPVWRETVSAVNAEDVLKKAKLFDSLEEAVSESHIVIGTSAGKERRRNEKWIGPEKFKSIVSQIAAGGKKLSIVFGSEKTGLTNENLNFCHYILTLPTDKKCPSMNLGQSAALVAYLLKTKNPVSKVKMTGLKNRVPLELLNRLIDQGIAALDGAQVISGWSPKKIDREIKRALLSWNLNNADVAMLFRIFRWIDRRKSS